MSAIVCPKCQYIRKYTDAAPIWQCPSCKIAYAKVFQAKNLNPKSIDEERFEEPEEYTEDSTRRRIKGFF